MQMAYWLLKELYFSVLFRKIKYEHEPSILIRVFVYPANTAVSLWPFLAAKDVSPWRLATQVQQFNRVGVATAVEKRGRIGCGCYR